MVGGVAPSLRGMSIGRSTGIGRGWVSKQQQEHDHRDAHQYRGADQATARPQTQLLDIVDRLGAAAGAPSRTVAGTAPLSPDHRLGRRSRSLRALQEGRRTHVLGEPG